MITSPIRARELSQQAMARALAKPVRTPLWGYLLAIALAGAVSWAVLS